MNAPKPDSSTSGSDAAVVPGPHRLLIIEDDPQIRLSYRRILSHAGYALTEAGSIGAARKILNGPTDFHAALVDYNLPDGTAMEIVAELVERRPVCRSTVVTGAGGVEVASESARAGAHLYLRKPTTATEILAAVARTVRSTLDWRHALRRAAGESNAEVPPITLDLEHAAARLQIVGKLSQPARVTAWRLLWGDSNARIAAGMNATERTVKYHVGEVLARTGARTRAGLLRVLAEDAGQVDPWGHRAVPADESFEDSIDEDSSDG